MGRREDLDTVLGRGGQQAFDVGLQDWQRRGIERRHRLRDAGDEFLEARRGDEDQHPGWSVAFVFEGVRYSARPLNKGSRAGDDAFAVEREGDFAFENEEGFVFAAMDVRWRTAPGQDACFKERVAAAGLVAAGENAVNIADGRESRTFARRGVNDLCSGGHGSRINNAAANFKVRESDARRIEKTVVSRRLIS